MPRPNKLLMGIASLLGAYTGRKRQEEDFLKRLNLRNALEEQQWQRRNKEQQQQALNRLLFSKGFSPGQEDEYFQSQQRQRQINERRAWGGTIGEQDMTDLFGQMGPRLEGLSQYSKDILADPVNYYPANFKRGSTSASKSQRAMQELQDSIVIGLLESPQGFTLEEATLQAKNLAPIFARQAFGPGSDERKLSGIDLMDKSDLMGAISE